MPTLSKDSNSEIQASIKQTLEHTLLCDNMQYACGACDIQKDIIHDTWHQFIFLSFSKTVSRYEGAITSSNILTPSLDCLTFGNLGKQLFALPSPQ